MHRSARIAGPRLTAWVAVVALVFSFAAAQADAPAGYYDSVDETSGATLRATIHALIDDHVIYPYTAATTDTWNILELADEDPNDSGRIVDVYRNRSFIKYGAGNTEYNREHTWPKSFGFPDESSTNVPYTDCHMLFLSDDGYNSSRSNYVFNDCPGGCNVYPVDGGGENYGKYEVPEGRWEVWDGRKGDMARAMFYMDVRYEGGTNAWTHAFEPDLILTDDINLIVASNTGNNETVAYMGILATLLQWHLDDPVDPREIYRNDVVYGFQGNRNPFVDHPEWVAPIFLGYVMAVGDQAPAASATIASIHPNPFNPATNIEFVLLETGTVRVQIFALDGSLVRTLLDEPQTAGSHVIRWNGQDDDGGRVASGAYFCRVLSGGGQDTRPLLLLK